MNAVQSVETVYINDDDSRDTHVNKLLQAINEIEPNRLGGTSYDRFIKHLFNIMEAALRYDATCLILIVEAIKSCTKPCYKRDVLLEILDQIVFSSDPIIAHVLCDPFRPNSRNVPWKVLANSIATLPELVANNDALKKFHRFQPREFFTIILEQLYGALSQLHNKRTGVDEGQMCFYVQLLGRIAFSGYSQLVWENFSHKLLTEKQVELKTMISNLLTFPLRFDSQSASQFELFIEPLYMPIFLNLKPSKNSGELIKSILGDHILNHESFEYLICNKSIFQANHKRGRHQQAMILFNIFAYLSCLLTDVHKFESIKQSSGSPLNKKHGYNLLIKTLLEIAQSWSNSTKILCRNYDQNRYISCAFIIAFRYVSEYDKQSLLGVAEVIQANIMRGFPIYLNRATGDYRHLALCIGETVLQALHELIDENLPKDRLKTKEPLKLDFGIELDDISLEMKRLHQVSVDEIFVDDKIDGCDDARFGDIASRGSLVLETVPEQSVCSDKNSQKSTRKSCDSSDRSSKNLSKRAIIDSGSISDDLLPHELSDDDDCDVGNGEFIGADSMNIPIYLRDCIDGFAENNNPSYVRLCLIKAGELISQLSEQEAVADKSINSSRPQDRLRYIEETDTCGSDAIRDTAKELAQLLLYLDDQYNIEGFDGLRIDALSSLCIAVPDLVAKYLLDEFNGSHRSTRHQLDILQVLTASARQLSGCPIDKKLQGAQAKSPNKFVKYVSLYFYGIVHQLKADLSHCISPATIVSVAKSQGSYASVSNKGGETMIRRVITGLANSRNQLSILPDKNFLHSRARTTVEAVGQGDVLVKEGSTLTSCKESPTTTAAKSSSQNEDSGLKERHFMDDGQSLERNCDRLDDSYLLSRIFFSVALILECVRQQPITCKLSNDLLDILATYRYHSDSGVREAIASCLTAMRDSTPSVYFKDCLYDKTASLFGHWLANETEIVRMY